MNHSTVPRLVLATAAVAALTLSMSCKDKSNADSGSGTDGGGESSSLTFATYNAGLATGFVTYAPERESEIVAALNGVAADVVCLQEVWSPESIAAITDGVSGTFPHSYVEVSAESGADEPACTTDETDPLAACGHEFCEGAENLTDCILGSCIDEFNALSDGCTECAAANVGLNDIDAIVQTCLTGSSSYAWGGHNGLVLLSRTEMTDTASVDLPSWLVWRSAIAARVEGVDVTCTHLAAYLSSPTYAGADFESYEAEQAAQIDAMLTWADDRMVGDVAVILGDMNTGPTLAGGIEAELAANWELFGAAGWADPNVDQASPFCTWCGDNTLNEGDSDRTIDHVMVKGGTASAPERLLDGTVTISVDGSDVETSLSDHYGMGATVTW